MVGVVKFSVGLVVYYWLVGGVKFSVGLGLVVLRPEMSSNIHCQEITGWFLETTIYRFLDARLARGNSWMILAAWISRCNKWKV